MNPETSKYLAAIGRQGQGPHEITSPRCGKPTNKNMISINREKGYICISRCAYLYRDGSNN